MNELAKTEVDLETAALALHNQNNADVMDMLAANAPVYFGFINIGAGQSKAVQATAIQSGSFFLASKDPREAVPLGWFGRKDGKLFGTLRSVIIGLRWKAALLVDNKPFLESFDPRSPDFRRIIQTKPVKPGQGKKVISPMYGPETLHYIPAGQINLEAMANDSTRGLSPAEMAKISRDFNGGMLATFHWKGTNKDNAPFNAEKVIPPFSAWEISTDLQSYKDNQWYTSPLSTDLTGTEEGQALVEEARSFVTAEHIDAFLNPQTSQPEVEDMEDEEESSER